MSDPLFYILAPFGLAFGLFAVYLVVSIILKDPARPFRMFKAPPLNLEEDLQTRRRGDAETRSSEENDAETRRHGEEE